MPIETDSHLSLAERKELAALLFPQVKHDREYYEQLYPKRELPEGAFVTRFAPSPTGFVHIGGIYASLISKRLAEQTKGIFFLRIEDTDQKREIEGGIEGIIATMHNFGVAPMEGQVGLDETIGEYGPYIQSQRKEIYDTFAKWMVEQGFAYPCFCTEAELEAIAQQQEQQGIMKKGYYGSWAKHRDLTLAEIKEYLAGGKGFVTRVRTPAQPRPARFKDVIRGEVEMEGNFVDTVLIKSSGLPTYHFAHVVDDHLMRTTHVTRGEEWLSSAPLHVQLFEMMGLKVPKYLHFSHIGKKEGNSIRKLSKRKDAEAAMSTYTELGYPHQAVTEYLLNLINPNFDDWRRNNPSKPNSEFVIDPKKIGKNIALFDQKKLDGFSQDVIAKMTAQEVYDNVVTWAEKYDAELHQQLRADAAYAVAIFNIERQQVQPRKDFISWSSIRQHIWYFFDNWFAEKAAEFPLHQNQAADVVAFLQSFKPLLTAGLDKEAWMEACRKLAAEQGYAYDLKSFKETPDAFKGHVGDLMTCLRFAVTKETRTPDLYQIVQVLGAPRVEQRLDAAMQQLAQ